MNKTKEKIKQLVILCLIITATLFTYQLQVHATLDLNSTEYDNSQGQIRVGLFFADKNKSSKSNAISSFEISAEKGMEVGYEFEGEFIKIYETNNNEHLMIRNDKYNDKVKLGPFHIQLGGAFDSYENVKAQIEIYKNKGMATYAAYDDSWYIWTGFYIDLNSAESDIINIKKISKQVDCSVILPSIENIVVSNGITGEPVLIFGDKNAFLQLKPKSIDGEFIFKINDEKYRGIIEVRRYSSSDMTVINILPLEHYLYGVVPCEIQWASHEEALKAQAVAARTYACYNLGKYLSLGFDVCSTVYSQVYGGYTNERESTNKAVDETRGEKLYYNEELAQVFFFSSSGGMTEASNNVWSGYLPYLQGVEDKYEEVDSKNYTWIKILTIDELQDILLSKGHDLGKVNGINIVNTSKAGRAIEVLVKGSKGNKVFLKSQCREVFNLPSQWYTISQDTDSVALTSSRGITVNAQIGGKSIVTKNGLISNQLGREVSILGNNNVLRKLTSVSNNYVFTGKGYGHGVGLSQQGAKGMAKAGFLYNEILEHYFSGIEIKKDSR